MNIFYTNQLSKQLPSSRTIKDVFMNSTCPKKLDICSPHFFSPNDFKAHKIATEFQGYIKIRRYAETFAKANSNERKSPISFSQPNKNSDF